MANRLFLLIIACLVAVISAPTFLTAADTVSVKGLDNTGVVETVPLPEPEPEPEPVATTVVAKAPAAGVSAPTQPVAAAPAVRNYTVTIFSGEMVAHNLSYGDIYKTGKLVYGHNTGNLLGSLSGLGVGQTFTVTEGGVTTTYRVTDRATYEKTADGYLNHNRGLMGQIMRTAMGHNIALMTCAGTSYGNGDASHRLVIYGDAV